MPDDKSQEDDGVEELAIGVPESAMKPDDPDADISALALKMADIPTAANGLDTPTIYADMIRGAFVARDVTKFNFFENRMDLLGDSIVAIPVATVVCPSTQLRAWGEFFLRLADQLDLPVEDVQ